MMTKIYSYKYADYIICTLDKDEAKEFGITGIMYGTETDLELSWQDENCICIGDVVYVSGNLKNHNYYIEKIIAC